MTVRLYTRRGCHLCEVVEERLADLADAYPHQLVRLDIDLDEALRQRYGQAVPVVIIDDRWRLVTRMDQPTLERALRRAGGG